MGKLLLPGLSPPLSNTPDPADKNKEDNVGQAGNSLPFYPNSGPSILRPRSTSVHLHARLVCRHCQSLVSSQGLEHRAHEWFSQLRLKDSAVELSCSPALASRDKGMCRDLDSTENFEPSLL